MDTLSHFVKACFMATMPHVIVTLCKIIPPISRPGHTCKKQKKVRHSMQRKRKNKNEGRWKADIKSLREIGERKEG